MTKGNNGNEDRFSASVSAKGDGLDEGINPLSLGDIFQDPQGLLDVQYRTIDEIKETCIVVLDTSVMLLPYVMGTVTLKEVIAVYKPLAAQKRLVVPAQSAREFGKNRSGKIAEIVKHLNDQASKIVPPIRNHIGFLVDDPEFLEVKKLSDDIGNLANEIQAKIRTIVLRISAEVGRDPVSDSYREVFTGCVRDENEPADISTFQKEMHERYANRRPPGYKDRNKADQGAGDLLIWHSILRAGEAGPHDCIFVTADEKSDWYTQSQGAFQPRLELIEEYRVKAKGGTLHIVPLSRLLQLYGADETAVENTRKAEQSVAGPGLRPVQRSSQSDEASNLQFLSAKLIEIDRRIAAAQERLASFGPEDFNTSLSLPWNRATREARLEIASLVASRDEIERGIRSILIQDLGVSEVNALNE